MTWAQQHYKYSTQRIESFEERIIVGAGDTAFVDVSVVPMTEETVLDRMTVVVRSGRISEMGPIATLRVPEGARVIDGTGRYLMPGLADMHTHLAFRSTDPQHLVLYLAEGTTTVRSLSGDPMNARWREDVASGSLIGPTIMTAGPTIIGPVGAAPSHLGVLPLAQVDSVDAAVEEVQRQVGLDWPDLIKVYDHLPASVYLAAVKAARAAGRYVAGHLHDDIPLREIVEAGLDEIAHLDELNIPHWIGRPGEPGFALDFDAIAETAELLSTRAVSVVSNLSADEVMIELIEDTDAVLSRPEYRVVSPAILDHWRHSGRQLGPFASQGPYRRDQEFPFFSKLLAELHAAGVTLLVGTDTSALAEGTLPTHIHRELELLVDAGLTPFDALAAATTNAAAVADRMGCDGSFGSVAPGQRADLLLLDHNPLDEISSTRHRAGVMAGGRYLTQTTLDRMVSEYISMHEEALT